MDQPAPQTQPATPSAAPPPRHTARAALALLTSPLWVPWVLVRGLTRICGEGLLFSLETLRGKPLDLELGPARMLFDSLAVLAFPVFVAVETAWSLLLALSELVIAPPPPGTRRSVVGRLLLGVLLLLLAPLWCPLYGAWWLLRRLSQELIGPTVGRIARGEPPPRRGGRFETFVALRYMRGRKSAGVSVVTGLTTAGVTVGVMTLIVVLSVMAGFEKDLQDKILGSNSHVIVRSYWNTIENWEQIKETVDGTEGVLASTPFLYTEFMLRSRDSVTGAIFKGIHPATVGGVTDVLSNITVGPRGRVKDGEAAGILANLDDPDWPEPLDGNGKPAEPPPKLPGLLIGQEMAAQLAVTVGDVVRGISPQGEPGPMGMRARVDEFVVVGIFHSGMYEYDTKFAYATLDTVGKFIKSDGGVTGFEIKVGDIYEAPRIAGLIGARLKYPLWTQDWQKMNEGLFKALKLEKTVMGIILTFIVAVACLNIISTLSMMVIEKAREIAILKAMGAGRLAILKLFMIDGLIVGFIGTTLGITLGLATCWALARWEFIPLSSDVYYVDTLPVHVSPGTVAVVAVIAVSIAFLSTLYPSSQAASLDPVEGLRDA
ncbi:MAG: ABC transporter permease [Deltaproteobacteria bacterium]|nr:ABC transporter permease [Deltaproteobacteria bacterium]